MPVYAVNIQHRFDYRGETQNGGNTYHYEFGSDVPGDNQTFESLADEIAVIHANIIPSTLDIGRVSIWGPTDGPEADSVMVYDEIDGRSGVVGAALTPAYRTVAVLCVWPLPRSPITNRKRWLRKFLRPVDAFEFGNDELAGRASIQGGIGDTMLQEYLQAITTPATTNGTVDICTADGTLPTADPVYRDFLRTRQVNG